MITTRFAPSPTGLLHLGHAYSALFAEATAKGGRFLLRIEDIDHTRSRPDFEKAIYEDLSWLGLRWEPDVMRQSERIETYRRALSGLRSRGLAYPCFCSRKDVKNALANTEVGAPHGPAFDPYPGTCRSLTPERVDELEASGQPFALRLDLARALGDLGGTGGLHWHEEGVGDIPFDPGEVGDVILARRDIGTSYHLSVTIDDAAQGVTLVTRGRDLAPSTHVHRLLQALLDLPVPRWQHHQLIEDATGQRLAKRDGATSLRALRDAGATPDDLRRQLQNHPA